MSKYKYWKCSERENKEGFGVKNIATNTYYAGEDVIDLINSLDKQLTEYKEKNSILKDKIGNYRSVLEDLITW